MGGLTDADRDVIIMATGSLLSQVGIREQLFPIILGVNGKDYKLLVKESSIAHIVENKAAVVEQLRGLLPPEPPSEPLYIDIVSASNVDQILIPSQSTSRSEIINPNCSSNETGPPSQSSISGQPTCTSQSTSTLSQSPSTSGLPSRSTLDTDPNYDEDEDDQEDSKRNRYEWSFGATNRLLEVIKEKKSMLDKAVNKKAVWNGIAIDVKKTCKKICVTGEQCRERYYTMKKKYRKHQMEGKKTGNSSQKPFIYEEMMDELLMDDPAFNPKYTKGSLAPKRKKEDSDVDDDEEATESRGVEVEVEKRPKAPKKKMVDELKDFLSERDDKFLNVLQQMNEANNKLIEKLLTSKESQS